MSDTSRVEQLLRNALGEDIYEVTPQSRVEVLLQQLNEVIEDMGASVDPTVIEQIVTDWLEEHPEATTTVQDGAITLAKLHPDVRADVEEIDELKSDLATKADLDELYKAFPTDTASGAIASFSDGAELPLKSLAVDIEPVQEGTGDPSPDNVRPISGHAQAVVTRTGKNLFDKSAVSTGMWLSTTTGLEEANGSYCVSDYIPVKSGETVYIAGSGTARRWFYDKYKNPVTYLNNSSNQAFTPTADGYIRVTIAVSGSDAKDLNTYQIEYGSTATSYEPYSGQSITIDLGQTVYGGTLDVLSGELVIDRAYKNKDNVRKEVYTINGHTVWLMEYGTAQINSDVVSPISSVLKQGNYNDIYSGTMDIVAQNSQGRLLAYVSGISSTSDIDTWLAANPDFLVVYKLATPITVQLTPYEVTALLGSNNVWADSGDSAVEYRADPTLYIQRLTEPDADMVADANITSGQYFMVGNTLYKATANIASGGAITPNVNCTRKSLSEALNEINA